MVSVYNEIHNYCIKRCANCWPQFLCRLFLLLLLFETQYSRSLWHDNFVCQDTLESPDNHFIMVRCSVRVRTDQSSHEFGVEALLGHLLRQVAPELRCVLIESEAGTKPVVFTKMSFVINANKKGIYNNNNTCPEAGSHLAAPGSERPTWGPLTSSRIWWCRNRRCRPSSWPSPALRQNTMLNNLQIIWWSLNSNLPCNLLLDIRSQSCSIIQPVSGL